MRPFLRLLLPGVAAVAVAVPTLASAAGSGGLSGLAFYVDGQRYRTVATPTDFADTGAPDHSYDIIYGFAGGVQPSVAEAAPGDPGFNGGRWEAHNITFNDYGAAVAAFDTNGSGNFDSNEEVEAAIAGGALVDAGVVRRFECTVVPVPASW